MATLASMVAGGLWWPIFFGAMACLCADEFIAMVRVKGIHPSAGIIRGMIIAFFVAAALPAVRPLNLPWDFSLAHFPVLLTFGVGAAFFRLLFRHENQLTTIADIAATILGFIYLGWMPSHLVLLRNLPIAGAAVAANPLQEPGLAYVWAAIFVIVTTDVFAYYCGKRFGKHALYRKVSPRKTVEGAVAGFVASMAMAVLVVYVSDHYLFGVHPFNFNLWQAPLMGAVVSIAAQLGDLSESLLKRDAGIKDSSSLIPGHGGFLDRGDSFIFAGAVSYYWIVAVVQHVF